MQGFGYNHRVNTSELGTRQRPIKVAHPDAVRRTNSGVFPMSDLMPMMALAGAIYGWLLVLVAVVVVAILALIR